MNNLWLNIRFGIYHLQCGDPRWWSVKIKANPYHIGNRKRFEVYQFFGYWLAKK